MVSFSSLTLLPVPTFFVSERIVPERFTLLAPLAERRVVPQLLNFKSASLAPLRSALMVSTPVRGSLQFARSAQPCVELATFYVLQLNVAGAG